MTIWKKKHCMKLNILLLWIFLMVFRLNRYHSVQNLIRLRGRQIASTNGEIALENSSWILKWIYRNSEMNRIRNNKRLTESFDYACSTFLIHWILYSLSGFSGDLRLIQRQLWGYEHLILRGLEQKSRCQQIVNWKVC